MTFSYIFSKAIGPVVTKFHVEPPWAGGTKTCSMVQSHDHHGCLAHMIYGNQSAAGTGDLSIIRGKTVGESEKRH